MDDKKFSWLKLDNAAKIYPAAKNRGWTALFRFTADFYREVDPDCLKIALDRTIKRFPWLALRIRKGVFWHYFEHMDGAPDMQSDVANPCVRMKFSENNHFLFRVRYYDMHIAVEIFHSLTDGGGGLSFFKTLVAEYLTLREGLVIPRDDDVLDCDDEPHPDEYEDSFLRLNTDATRSSMEGYAYRVQATEEENDFVHITTGTLPADKVSLIAKSYGVSVTEFITALLIHSIHKQQARLKKRKQFKPVKICVPVNLRKLFPTKTKRNFATYVNPGINPKYGEYSLREICKAVKGFMMLEVDDKKLRAKFSSNVKVEKNILLRLCPLILKIPIMKLSFRVLGDKQTSSCFSNLGLANLPSPMAEAVKHIDFILGPLQLNRLVASCLTHQNELRIHFTRTLKESEIERNFFCSLVEMGLPVTLESNQLRKKG
jgi:NRPS condensation-like uncharacterized protein